MNTEPLPENSPLNPDPRNLSRYSGVRVAVLGAAGFIGRWVARALSAQGAQLYLVVRDREAARKLFSKYDVHGEVSVLDLSDENAVRQCLAAVRPSITFNLAGYGVDPAERDVGLAYRINVELVSMVCLSLSETRDPAWLGQRLVHVGSALEYGAIAGNLVETSTPNPTTIYGKSKLAGTLLLASHCQTHGLAGMTARLFNVYGAGEHPGRLLPSLIESARLGEPLPLTSGHQKRDFTYVEDVAEGLLRIGLAEATPGEIVNLATGQLSTVRRFTETAASILGIPDECLVFGALPTRDEEMAHMQVSVRRLQQVTGWVPGTAIGEGIRRTLRFEAQPGHYTGEFIHGQEQKTESPEQQQYT